MQDQNRGCSHNKILGHVQPNITYVNIIVSLASSLFCGDGKKCLDQFTEAFHPRNWGMLNDVDVCNTLYGLVLAHIMDITKTVKFACKGTAF